MNETGIGAMTQAQNGPGFSMQYVRFDADLIPNHPADREHDKYQQKTTGLISPSGVRFFSPVPALNRPADSGKDQRKKEKYFVG